MSGHAGCNRYAAAISFGPQAGEVTVSHGMTTRMACKTRRMEFEAAFIKAFEASRRYRLDGERLSFESEVAPPLEFYRRPLACRESPFLPAARHTISPRRTDATAPLRGNGAAAFHWCLPDEKVVIIDGDVTTCAN